MSVLVFRVGLAARQWWCDDESINWNVSSIWAAFLNDFGKCWPMKQRSLRLQIDFYYKYTVRKKLIYILAKPKFNSFYWTRMKEKMLTPIRISICYFFLSHKHTIKKKTLYWYSVHCTHCKQFWKYLLRERRTTFFGICKRNRLLCGLPYLL